MKYIETNKYIDTIYSLSNKKLYIVGAGKCGEVLGEYCDKYGIVWEGYIDKRASLIQKKGKKIYSYEEIKGNEGYYLISTYIYRKEIVEELRKNRINLDKIIIYENQNIFYDIYEDIIHWKKYTNKIKRFFRIHEDERCFIIGNGPSLRIEDLEKLKREFTFASNSIYALYQFTDWRPTYYCAWDPIFCKKMMSDKENIMTIMNGCKATFTSILSEGIKYRDDKDITQLYYVRSVLEEDETGWPRFSTDCGEQVYASGSITYVMLQLAVYMGFKDIHLLGMDFNYSVERYKDGTIIINDIGDHMDQIQKEESKIVSEIKKRYNVSYIADKDIQLMGYQATKEYANTHKIKIYNATRGGKLEVFERVDFDNIF